MTCDKLMSLSNRFPQNVCVVRTSRTHASSLELVEMLNTIYLPKVMFQPYKAPTHPPSTHNSMFFSTLSYNLHAQGEEDVALAHM